MNNAARTFVYLVAGLPFAVVSLALLVAGWVAVPLVAITPLVVPALIGFRAGVGAVARADAELANGLLGTRVRPPVSSPPATGFWRRATSVLTDPNFWSQQLYLLIRTVLGFAIAVAEIALVGASLMAIALPVYYRWTDNEIGSWQVDTLGRALLFVPVGFAGLALAIALLWPIRALWRSLVYGLLGKSLPVPGHRALLLHAAVVAAVSAVILIVWAATPHTSFWPIWVLLPLALALGVHAWIAFLSARPDLTDRRPLLITGGVAVALTLFVTAIWAAAGQGYFWPIWVALGLATLFGTHLALTAVQRRRRRIEVLETTRAGAVDQQETELRRIERDLHDGAQARLVALGMSIGMAEQKLAADDPEGARVLLGEARTGAREALEELRDLARGIHPPVLADRGLEAAVSALADRSPLRVSIAVDVPARPAPAVETAAYFVVAEALANTGKHSGAGHVDIGIRRTGDTLVVQVVDDGHGRADPDGNGLRGLARRVEALDGTLSVLSPAGGPTVVKAVMPCGS
jgi:signal transduction histidine kinase